MPRGTAFDIDTIKVINATEIKKEGETTTTEVWAPATGKRFRICGFSIFLATAQSVVTLEDETTAFYVVAVEKLAAGANFILPQQGYLSVKAGNKLKIKLSATNTVTASFFGTEDVA